VKLFKILEKMTEKKIRFCINVHPEHSYYNLMVEQPNGKDKYFHIKSIQDMEQCLDIMYGSLLAPAKAMPLPAGFPMP